MAMGRGIASALTLLLLLAHPAVGQTREHVLGGRALRGAQGHQHRGKR
jgi:hypothetical protein